MNIDFYKTSDPENKINKTLTDKNTVTGNFKDVANVLSPVIRVASNIFAYNYCHIQDLERYYFIDDITVVRTGLFEVKLKIDVLKTYSNSLDSCNVLTSKSNKNKYLSGYAQTVDSRYVHTYYDLENNFNESGSVILVAINGVRSGGVS